MAEHDYLCWCDGTACNGTTDKPFSVCAHCRSLGHSPLPRPEGATDDLVKVPKARDDLPEIANAVIDRIVQRWEADGWEYGAPYTRSQALDALYAIGAFAALPDVIRMLVRLHGHDEVRKAIEAGS